ncbi:MAG TPA: peptidoglycan DD-metalloendopeptidase family protein [Bacteroidales bacterium]|nr:peptidoglycan DD-metalloendopeptidase family protein [Bacteroidales bacterium]
MQRKKLYIEIITLIVLTVILVSAVMLMRPLGAELADDPIDEPGPPLMEYGIPVDSLEVVRDVVKRNEFLADILLRYDVDYNLIDRIARSPREVFDVRKIRVGYPYSVIRTLDTIPQVQYFIYEQSPTEYIVIDIRDSLVIEKGIKLIERRLAKTSGTITSSLWNTLIANDADPNLANELSEIYAWTIDFFGIQKGDYFRAIFEELYVEDDYIGLGRVIAAEFFHAGHDYYACYFEQDSVGDYFDDEGGSLRRTFLKAPLRYRRISSGFSYSRMHPVLKYRRPHTGVDYAAAAGTPVLAVGEGVVTFAAYTKEGGYTVKIKHNGTYSTSYCHFSGFGKGIKKGVHVKQGQVIGYVGSTGLATGPHLDFRFYRNGKPIDPLKVQSPPAEPVDSAYYGQYRIYCDSLVQELGLIPLIQ